jgi:hypothetical protein
MDGATISKEEISILREICASGFGYLKTKELAAEAGWKIVDDQLGLGYVRFAMPSAPREDYPRHLAVLVSDSGKSPLAFVTLYFFEEYETNRRPFDFEFESLAKHLETILGRPTKSAQYSYDHQKEWPYSYAWWSLSDVSIVLAQDEMDIQFGMDISVWVLPAKAPIKLPVSAALQEPAV